MSLSYDSHISPQPEPLPGRVDSEKGQPQSFVHENNSSYNTISKTRWRICAAWSNVKMPSFRQFFFTFLIAAFLTSAFARRPIYLRKPGVALSGPGDESTFQDLLSQVSDSSLHEVLHDVSDKYKHGIYPEDRTALQEIHKDNPAMATSLVKLARRQNTTVTNVDSLTSTSTVAVTTDTTGQTITAQNPQSSQSSTQGSTTAKTTGTGTGTGTFAAGRSSSAGAVSTGNSNSNSASTSAAESSGGQTSGTATAGTSTTQQIIFTTTLPNGSRSTVTSFTIVPAGEQAATAGASASATGTPSLQSGAIEKGNPSSMRAMVALLAALVFVMGVL